MFKLSLKHIWSRKGRLVLTAIAVIAGTAFLSGVFVFTDTIKGSFDRLFITAYENTDAFVRSANVIEGDFGNETRDRIDVDLVDVVRSVPGVVEAHGDVSGTAVMVFEDEVLGRGGPPTLGVAWVDSESSPWKITEGRPPSGPEEVVIDRASARIANIEPGDTVSISASAATRDFTVVGIAGFAGSDSAGGVTFAMFDLATAQEFVIGDITKLDSIVVVGDGELTQNELADTIQAAIADDDVEVLTGEEITEESQSAIAQNLSFMTLFLSIFALISMFVGSFIIYNVFSISAAQRQGENALLRAVGASRAQITRSMFTEALVVGLGGSLLGCLGGIGLASVILKLLNKLGFGPGDISLELQPKGFIITLLVGVLVTLVCAVAPAIRSGRVPPLAAMREVHVDRAAVSRRRKIVGVIALVVAVATVYAGLQGESIWLGVGVAAIFFAFIALGPFVAAPMATAVAPLLGRLRGAPGTMAGRNAARNPKRTALTAGALGIGLSLMIGVATLGASAKESLREIIGEAFSADYIVSPQQANNGFLPASLADDLKATGVGGVLGLAISPLRVDENGELNDRIALAVVPADAAAVLDFSFLSGSFADLDASGVLLSADKADGLGVGQGDTVTVTLLDDSELPLVVQGVYDADQFGAFVVDRSIFDGQSQPVLDVSVFVNTGGNQSATTEAALRAVIDAYPSAKLQSRDSFIDEQDDQIDGFLNFIYALLGMSIFIAIIGIVITLWLSVYERRRELGLLRAVGMTKRQVRSSVLWESMVTGIVGVVMGIVLGVTLGWIIVKAFEDDGLGVFSLPTGTIVVASVGALALAAMAAFIPARRASNADMLEAIATT